MTASWAAVAVAGLMMGGGLLTALWRGGRRDGKLDQLLEELTALGKDHEVRLRVLEDRRRR